MTPTRFITTHRIGASIALVSGVSGAVVLTNDFGLHILDGLDAGFSPEEIAFQIAETSQDHVDALHAVTTVIEAWDRAGLLSQVAPNFPAPVSYKPPSHARSLHVGGIAGNSEILTSDTVLGEQIDTILGHLRPRSAKQRTQLWAQPSADGFAVFRDERPLSGQISLDAARFVLLHEVAQIACGEQDVAAVFHAGCVQRQGRALVLCGTSGQGKSTLTFDLVDAGCEYLGDDHIPLHRDAKSAMAFPTAAGIKHTAWDLPQIKRLQDRFGLSTHTPREGVRYLPLHRATSLSIGEKSPIAALVFPHFHPDNIFEITRITPEQALIQTLQAGSRLSHSHKSDIAPLAKFLNDTPAYDLHYSTSDQSVSACLNLLAS